MLPNNIKFKVFECDRGSRSIEEIKDDTYEIKWEAQFNSIIPQEGQLIHNVCYRRVLKVVHNHDRKEIHVFWQTLNTEFFHLPSEVFQ